MTKGKFNGILGAINFYTLMQKKLLILVVITLILIAGLAYLFARPESSSDSINESDYMGGCAVERYINGDCIFDYIKMSRHEYYPLVTEDDGVWDRVKEYNKDELLKISKEELERIRKNEKYKFQQEQITRVQSFIDILSRR